MKHLDQTTLNLYLDDMLAPAVRASADSHLAECETCRAELQALTELGAVFDAWRTEPIPHDVSHQVMQEIAKRPAPAWVSRWGAVVLGAQAVLAVLLVLWLLPNLSRLSNVMPALPLPAFEPNLITIFGAWLDTLPVLVPSYGLWIWGTVILGGAVIWLVVNRLVFRSLDSTKETTQ
jgi:hypothetical protein